MAKGVEQYKLARKKTETALKEAKDMVKQVFTDASSELFTKNLALIRFTWRQYTPYFNDGDKCTFSVHGEASITFRASDGSVVEFNDDYAEMSVDGEDIKYDSPAYNAYKEEGEPLLKTVAEFLGIFEEDDLRSIFGDHVEITMTSDGSTVKEYSHD